MNQSEDVDSSASNSSNRVTSEAVAGQIKAATDPLIRQLDRLCDSMEELKQVPPKHNEEASGLIQGHLRPHGSKFDSLTCINMPGLKSQKYSPLNSPVSKI